MPNTLDDDDRPGRKSAGMVSKAPAAPGVVNKARGSMPTPAPRKIVTTAERQAERVQGRTAAPPPQTLHVAAAANNEALQAEVSRFNDLQKDVMLTDVNDDLEDIESVINDLPANLENIRARGYVFKNFLEKKSQTLGQQWRDLRPRVEETIRQQARNLQADAQNVQNTLNRGQLAGLALSGLESKVQAAVNNLKGMFNTLKTNVDQTQSQINDISWTLQQAEQATFSLQATEAPVEAAPANWKKPEDKDGVEGVLFLTDQRLIFEQKEEVATKKVLFVVTEKQKLQSLQWELPLAQVEKAVGSTRGFMGKDDFLTIHCGSGAVFRQTDLHLKGETGESWQGFIGRVKSGDIDKERTTPVDQAAVEAVRNAPTKCGNCGATISQTIQRGQTEITCEFCGSKTRL